jgi:hypothetical protein
MPKWVWRLRKAPNTPEWLRSSVCTVTAIFLSYINKSSLVQLLSASGQLFRIPLAAALPALRRIPGQLTSDLTQLLPQAWQTAANGNLPFEVELRLHFA